ncbi:hypothetical protein AgCh_027172 [Apium graveolens]
MDISCKKSSDGSQKAFLRSSEVSRGKGAPKSLELELLEISLQAGTVRVNCPISVGSNNVDYTRLPMHFTFSNAENIFVAMGCDNFAYLLAEKCMVWDLPSRSNITGICTSVCERSAEKDNSCSGLNCCKTRFAPPDNFIMVFISGINGNYYNQDTRSAFVVDQHWFENLKDIYSVQKMKSVPVVLNWTTEWNCKSRADTNFCGTNTFCTNQSLCSCFKGYHGNPYLPEGCQVTCAGLGVLFPTTCWLYKEIRLRKIRKLKEKFFKRNGGILLHQHVSSSNKYVEATKLFTSTELEKATDRFNVERVLGKGEQGTVYKGMLTDGTTVAVKKSKIEHENRVKHFINEYIHEPNEYFPLTWDVRLRVAKEVAGAIFYLHSAAVIPIYHRDIKSANILLDDKYRAKVADFGTSTTISIDQTHLTTGVQGTFGYFDPEYVRTKQFTDKSDVYSFGVVLVELLTGQKPVLPATLDRLAKSLAEIFLLAMEENRILDILDSQITNEGSLEEIIAFANIARRCLNSSRRNRPTMKQVVAELEKIRNTNETPSDEQNYEEDDDGINEVNEPWESDVTSSSMNSTVYHSHTVELEPLIE